MQADALNKELQTLSDVKVRLEEDNYGLKRKVLDLEDSNNALRKQLVDARRSTMLQCLCISSYVKPGRSLAWMFFLTSGNVAGRSISRVAIGGAHRRSWSSEAMPK